MICRKVRADAMGNAIIVSHTYICMPLLHSGLVDLFLDYLAA